MEQVDLNEVQITAMYEQWTNFLSSAVWQDMQAEINYWLNTVRASLGSNDEPRELFRMQGRLEACENVLELPNNMLEILEDRYNKLATAKSAFDTNEDQAMFDDLFKE